MHVISAAELPAFPVPLGASDDRLTFQSRAENGMTYRQWLIGQIAAGMSANPTHAVSQVARLSIHLADEIIRQMDHEPPADL